MTSRDIPNGVKLREDRLLDEVKQLYTGIFDDADEISSFTPSQSLML